MKTFIQNLAVLTLSFATSFSSNWTGEFELKNGYKIIKNSEFIIIEKPALSHDESTTSNDTFSTVKMKPKSQLGSLTLRDFLYLDMNLTENAFVRALIDSGSYEPTEEQMNDYQNSAQWSEKFTLDTCTISHSPQRVAVHITNIGKLVSAKNYFLIGILLRTHSTQEEFARNIEILRGLRL
ncbi:MAG: hypothetical protein C0432_02495 [Candidatus Puniceispirillum sp.]|nr:hypothetical protein [Candidatus Pelagibacter sp.]MBA4283144.1 hypothetical protein [Candidatus Puniceispirillum sp.]